MSYTRSQHFEPGTFLRSCDICGIRFRANELRKGDDGFWRCTRWCQEIPAITRDRISAASQKRVEAPPPPHGIPFDQLDTYAQESQLFNLLAERPVLDASWPGGSRLGIAPFLTVSAFTCVTTAAGRYSYGAAGETCRYLYDIINEAKRPTRWTTAAQAKLASLADWLVTKQNTTGNADTNLAFGGFDLAGVGQGSTVTYDIGDAAKAGIGLLMAYQIFGTFSYLAAARRVAAFVRACQWSAYTAFTFTSSDSGGAVRLYTGGHSRRLINDAGLGRLTFDSNFIAADSLHATEFLVRLKAIDGDGTYGGLGVSGTQSFVTTSAATLTSMITDALSFWAAGTLDVVLGTVITGLSATTPREFFNAYPASKGSDAGTGIGAWAFAAGGAGGTQVTSQRFALALRSLHYISGYNTQVASVWTWLMSFASNPANVGAANTYPIDFSIATTQKAASLPTPPVGQGNIIRPTYDPKLALATFLTVRDAQLNATAIDGTGFGYDWSTTGLMAAILATQDGGAMKRAKDVIASERLRLPVQWLRSGDYPIQTILAIQGTSGLSYQTDPVASAGFASWNVERMPMCGAVFRYQPQGWTGTGAPGMTPGVRV